MLIDKIGYWSLGIAISGFCVLGGIIGLLATMGASTIIGPFILAGALLLVGAVALSFIIYDICKSESPVLNHQLSGSNDSAIPLLQNSADSTVRISQRLNSRSKVSSVDPASSASTNSLGQRFLNFIFCTLFGRSTTNDPPSYYTATQSASAPTRSIISNNKPPPYPTPGT